MVKSRKTKRGGSLRMKKIVPWGLVLANQLFSKRLSLAKSRKRTKTKRRRRRRRTRRR